MNTENKEKIADEIVVVEKQQETKDKIDGRFFVIAIKDSFVVVSNKNGDVKCIECFTGNTKIGDEISI